MNEAFKEYMTAFRTPLIQKWYGIILAREEFLKTEPEYIEEINAQFYDKIAEGIIEELSKNFNTTPEEVLLFICTFDIEKWLNNE